MIICALRLIANDYLFSIYFRLIGHARGGSADRDHQQNAGILQHKDLTLAGTTKINSSITN